MMDCSTLEDKNMSTIERTHQLVESFKFAFSDKRALGDSSFVNMTNFVSLMDSKDHAYQLRQRISLSIHTMI